MKYLGPCIYFNPEEIGRALPRAVEGMVRLREQRKSPCPVNPDIFWEELTEENMMHLLQERREAQSLTRCGRQALMYCCMSLILKPSPENKMYFRDCLSPEPTMP